MSAQEWTVAAILAGAVLYLVARRLRRQAIGNCCGEKECPAAAQVVQKLERARKP